MAFSDLLHGRPLIAILRGVAADDAVRISHAVWDSGIGRVELPIQTPEAIEALRAVAAAGAARGEVVGAGTVVNTTLVDVAADAGAGFTVAPGLDEDVWQASLTAGLPHLPGVATATEVHRAMRLGAEWVKVFPAGALGPTWFTAMRGPFPQARFVATGAIDAGNVGDFLRAGVVAVGVGGSITQPGGVEAIVEAVRHHM
jgi:2-dehydro-3-deoxyphosphogluconate aldolase/(4S)-4-hydroxy-2-oxoglutarate aldolase